FQLNEIVTNFQDLPPSIALDDINNRNGIIGNEILSRFYVIMDYARGQLYLKPNRRFKKKFKFDKSGLQIFAVGNNLNAFQIQYVIPNSPAANAGLQVGDKILSVNRLVAGFLSLRNVIEMLKGKEGKKIRIKINRDGEKMIKTFYLRKLI
ncbi:MAG: PDZ domain-containing protein, partial [Saprospiraceae bacterium]